MSRKTFLNNQTLFWIITVIFMTGLTLPKLVQNGMFMDAMLYTSVAHNLSQGIGTFWFPQFSHNNMAGLASFHEQPPLVFGLQAVFYKLFGDSMYVERFYTFLMMCLNALLIILMWKEIYKNDGGLRKLSWLPVFLWITIPVCFWSYSNNMIENTMGLFTLLSVMLIYKGLRSKTKNVLLFIVSGICIFLATLSKGIPGFFPVVMPVLYWLIYKKDGDIKIKEIINSTAIIILTPVMIYAVLFYCPESRESLSLYILKRVMVRITGDPTVSNRFYILYRLVSELLFPMGVVGVMFLIAYIKQINYMFKEYFKTSLFFIGIGSAASLPLMLTMVQKGFYFVPSLPYFAIGLAVITAPAVYNLIGRINTTSRGYKVSIVVSVAILMAVMAFTVSRVGKTYREVSLLNDLALISRTVPKHSVIAATDNAFNDWSLQCYLIRYYNISLDPYNSYEYFLAGKNERPEVAVKYEKIDIQTSMYDIYSKTNNKKN